ncbi:GxGYxYP domain-containing protein [Tengunoibacter tsumagoiensis]|uniref:GxGYxYP putative glycoside hydrolase N-terminal domain-containing protein n=1 Tax=Tengunoibacter tsumagoiensis TaxID=2014871 RepID=A0A402A256_9CHLR|nr:GxGYxYP domain-containing protein [Tengunoibacter tsumagoiensis]GCE13233.1 hypothetical protein KTT_30920 [Tengunoibacter tsumagoiensis]
MSAAEVIWSAEQILPTFQTVEHLTIYALEGVSQDYQLAILTLVGLINRPQPLIYLVMNGDDEYWLKKICSTIPQERPSSVRDAILFDLLEHHRSVCTGLIIYDPELNDTINIATTLAGQRSGIIVSPVLAEILQHKYALPILVDLRQYGWENRIQAYTWAMENLLPLTTDRLVAGLKPDGVTWLRSFAVATRTFVYWLDSRRSLFSNGQSSERALMRKLLQAFPAGAAHLGWFEHESSGVALTSEAALSVYASDFCSNLEVLISLPAPVVRPHLPQKSNLVLDPQKIYLSFTLSEGDNLQYCQHHLLRLWQDPQRGVLPLGWTFSPALLQMAPALTNHYLSTATPNDEFIAGPSGIGYMFPSRWPVQHLVPFVQRTGAAMQALGMTTVQILDVDPLTRSGLPLLSKLSLTGMAFTACSRQHIFAQTLIPYGVQGLLTGTGFWVNRGSYRSVSNLPIYRNIGLAGSVKQALMLIKWASRRKKRHHPLFLNLYVLAWSLGPTQLCQLVEQLGETYQIVLPRTILTTLEEARRL